MMLDAKATFDELVARHAPDAETRDRILSNRIYQQLSNALAGSQEYMAMEKLFELYAEDRYDLLVLDTPPTRNALDFLEAPRRLHAVHRGPRASGVHEPTGLGMKVFGRGTSMMFSVLRRMTGVELLEDLSEFFQAFSGMVGGFRERPKRVNELLANPRDVASWSSAAPGRADRRGRVLPPQAGGGGAAVRRRDRQQGALRERARRPTTRAWSASSGRARRQGPRRRVIENFDDYRALAARDQRNIKRLTAEIARGS